MVTYFRVVDVPPGEGISTNLPPAGRPPPDPCPVLLFVAAAAAGVDVLEEELEQELELLAATLLFFLGWCAGALSCTALACSW